MELGEFLTAGGRASGEHWLIWYRPPRLWMTVLWGRPSADEIRQIVRIYDFALDERMDPTYLSLVDCAALEAVTPESFGVLHEYLAEKRAAFQARLARQALVRPAGLAGAVVAGIEDVLDLRVPLEVFTATEPALAWLVDGEKVAAELAAYVAAARDVAPVVREVRALLDGDLTLELSGVARALGRSTRALQHQLSGSGLSFRELRTAARVERAQQLLTERDDKITSIALEVGCASLQHFARMFRARTGMTPLEWRRRRE